MRAFIYDLQTTNELLFKERNNSLIELRFGVQELLKEINNIPKVDCDVKGVTTRGGKTMTRDVHDNNANVLPKEPLPSNEVQKPPVALPRRLRKEKEEAQQKKFLENLKQLYINFPFIEALAQMPKYAKFLKGLLTNKARLEEACKITINERCSAVLLNKLPSKEKDPGSFTIPCDIGQLHIDNALADLGASISLMPYTMYKKLSLGEPKDTRMSLELVDRSIQYPRGITKNVLIKVDKFILPIDLVILDMPVDSRVPIILGRPSCDHFDMIDVFNKNITLRVGDDEVIFDVDQSIKRPTTEDDECYRIDDLDDTSDLKCYESASRNENDGSDLENSIRRIDYANTPYPVMQGTKKHNDVKSKHLYSASADEIDEKKPKLKNLPQHLEYTYLHGDKSFPLSSYLNCPKKRKIHFYKYWRDEKGEIAWKMSDIKGISPSYCTHKIVMEDDYKPVIQPQRRLNPKVQDVVKNEIVKLFDFGLIYPISNSSWVSPIHVVPKKGGMTVVLNDNNELIPSRTVTGWRVILPNTIALEDQEKTTFSYPYGTFAYRRMPFGLSNLDRILARCEETNLVLNWEKCHFMVKEGIVLGHKIYGAGIEVDRAKIDVIAKLPYPTNVKGVRSFLGHAGFYRRIKGAENLAANYLSRLENLDLGTFMEEEITDEFPDEHLMILKAELNNDEPWYADYVNYIVGKIVPQNWTPEKRRRFFSQVKNYFWDEPYAFNLC
ncbi:putative nucleotidyltransferase, ribonuclease H [Tanacetum coccineum]|uniref:Nucleotidyltransferase, ribonuclease H n=1 Tax=Tanacetum coccineum TaxID=301880 RepID=A0ABQ4WJ55_9ASTR